MPGRAAVVVGGGISGLAGAIALRRAGWDVQVLERAGGRTVESGSLAELRHLRRTSITAEVGIGVPGLATMRGVHDLEVEGDRLRFQVDADVLDGVLELLGHAGVRALTCQPPTLEDLFLQHYATASVRSTDAVR